MAGITYPAVTAPSFKGDTVTINRFMQDAGLVTKRAQELSMNRYIADRLLTMQLRAQGGSLVIETGSPLGTNANPRAVSPLGDYPLVTINSGNLTAVQTVKWGQDTKVADEAIARLRLDPVNRAFQALVEQNVMFIDALAMSGINTAVTQSSTATAPLATATVEQLLTDIFGVVANLQNLNRGFVPDVAAMPPVAFATLSAKLATAKLLPDAQVTGLVAGTAFPTIQGLTFLPSPQAKAGEILVADSTRLGGMADETLGGPGYASARVPGAPAGVEAKSWRLEENDGYRLRVRRVTVPVIVEADAAWKLTGI